MRKTILTVATAFLLMVATSVAADRTNEKFNTDISGFIEGEISTFCKAVMQGDVETVKKLIDLGEDVNEKSLGMAPVHFAARYNKTDVLKILIKNGADLSQRCDKGWTVEKYAKISNAKDVLAILKNHA